MKKKQQSQKPTRSKLSILRQICNWIPDHLVSKLARQTKVEEEARTFKPWSHIVTLLYAQLTHSLGLNDVCDALELHSGPLSAIRGATAPKRNTLSHANRQRDPALAEKLFWQTLEHLQSLCPGFGGGRRPRFAFRFKRMIHLVDSTTIQLVANCMDWAKHRRRKAAAKCHLRLNLQSFLPRFAIVDTARHSDAKKAWELCAGLLAGEIVIFDKAYLDLLHLFELFQRSVNWVTRAKEGMNFRVVRRYQRGRIGNILRDDVVQMKSSASRRLYPAWLRRVVAMVEVDGDVFVIRSDVDRRAKILCHRADVSRGCVLFEIPNGNRQTDDAFQNLAGINGRELLFHIPVACLGKRLSNDCGITGDCAMTVERSDAEGAIVIGEMRAIQCAATDDAGNAQVALPVTG